ncbi:MAG: hypothetical protein KDD22_01805 [Bdellovibrionales bacterium]|nr:hypothetical protein [Bdellovibrionales bacterium]
MSDINKSTSWPKDWYQGSKSTLCVGCGHDSITTQIINALYKSKVNPFEVAKLSGIGCSSKTPTYFLSKSHGFNSIHGRMAPLATGVHLAQRHLKLIGVSGDGDTASIGLGGFLHLLRRNVPMVYIVENNGVYGLTKGQFSATADSGSNLKSGSTNPFKTIDLCSMALQAGCDFVARSFSGDAKQLQALLSAALRHPGTAFIDILSPCVTFANHDGSTKSFSYIKEHNLHLQEMGFIQPQEEVKIDYEEGQSTEVKLHDGSILWLAKIDSKVFSANDRTEALIQIRSAEEKGQILTGLFYMNSETQYLAESLNLSQQPLASQKLEVPSQATLDRLLEEFY